AGGRRGGRRRARGGGPRAVAPDTRGLFAALRRGLSPNRERLEEDERNLASGALAVSAPVRVVLDRPRPKSAALLHAGRAGAHRQAGTRNLDLGVRVRAQGVDPPPISRVTPLRGDDEQAVPA